MYQTITVQMIKPFLTLDKTLSPNKNCHDTDHFKHRIISKDNYEKFSV